MTVGEEKGKSLGIRRFEHIWTVEYASWYGSLWLGTIFLFGKLDFSLNFALFFVFLASMYEFFSQNLFFSLHFLKTPIFSHSPSLFLILRLFFSSSVSFSHSPSLFSTLRLFFSLSPVSFLSFPHISITFA